MLDENENIENINNIQETIGLWHDHDVTIERLKEFIEYNKEIIELLTKKRDNFYIESLELLKNL
jgi:CHAD domain-containing protein